MTGKQRDETFRKSAVELVTKEGYSLRQAAESLGINSQTLFEWVKKSKGAEAAAHAPPRVFDDSVAGLKARLAELERENARLRMEKDILKKATALFAKEQS